MECIQNVGRQLAVELGDSGFDFFFRGGIGGWRGFVCRGAFLVIFLFGCLEGGKFLELFQIGG